MASEQKRDEPRNAIPMELKELFRRARQVEKLSVNAIHRETGINRRLLQELIDGEARSISFRDLHQLGRFFGTRNLSLNRILERTTLLQGLLRGSTPTFLFGAHDERPGVSWWDMTALSELIRTTKGGDESFRPWDLQDVLLDPDTSSLGPDNYEARFESCHWFDLLRDDSDASLLSFAAPVSNHAAEIMLAKMFGVEPFCRDSDTPFKFVWEHSRYDAFPSAFAVDGSYLHDLPKQAKSDERSAWAMKIDGAYHWIDRQLPQTRTFGVIAAQRRALGQLWIVVAGLTGPATYAASRFLTALQDAPALEGEGHGVPVWIPIRADVAQDEPHRRHAVSPPRTLDDSETPRMRIGRGPLPERP